MIWSYKLRVMRSEEYIHLGLSEARERHKTVNYVNHPDFLLLAHFLLLLNGTGISSYYQLLGTAKPQSVFI